MANFGFKKTTNKQINDVLPSILSNIEKNYLNQPKKILNSWSEIVGEKISKLTKAYKFENNTLYIKVKSSTLYSILYRYEKNKLLKLLQEKFSKKTISNIVFKIE
ncbi:MAG: hypothetical protein K1060chlam5_00007 [Candidatus Anoxychlamydiales bacterium]|nr:hypothetical protein [Candidatus Anoxychlamydiales bacterium]